MSDGLSFPPEINAAIEVYATEQGVRADLAAQMLLIEGMKAVAKPVRHAVPFTYVMARPLTVDDVDGSGNVVGTTKTEKVKILREPRLKHLRKIYRHADGFDRFVETLRQLTDFPMELAEDLFGDDVAGLRAVVEPFLSEASPATAASSRAATTS